MNCFFRLLTDDQASKVPQHHLEIANKITEEFEGDISIGMIAQRYIELLTPEDFDLHYLKQSSLRGFYEMSKPVDGILSFFPKFDENKNATKLLQVYLNERSEMIVNEQIVRRDELSKIVKDFIQANPITRAVNINIVREASYESYINLLDIVAGSFHELRDAYSLSHFGQNFSKLSHEQKLEAEKAIPRNIIVNQPK